MTRVIFTVTDTVEGDRAMLKGSLLALTSALFYGSSTVIAKKGMGDLGIFT